MCKAELEARGGFECALKLGLGFLDFRTLHKRNVMPQTNYIQQNSIKFYMQKIELHNKNNYHSLKMSVSDIT